MEKKKGGVGRFFHYLFWGLITVIGGLVMLLGLWGGVLPALIGGSMFMLIGFAQLALYPVRRARKLEGTTAPKHKLGLCIGFNALVAVICIIGCSAFGSGALDNLSGGGELLLFVQAAVALFAVLSSWGLCLNLAYIGTASYVSAFKKFAKSYLGVFLLYQMAFALLAFLCNALVLLFGSAAGTQSAAMAMNGYFVFVTESEGGGIGNLGMEALTGLTTASSYFVLSTLAQDTLEKEEKASFGARLKRMLFDADTGKLLIMTVLCLVSSLCSGLLNGFVGTAFTLGCGVVWALSLFAFLKDTRLLWYTTNYAVMTMMEMAVPAPAITGVGSALLAVLLLAIRIGLFAFVAMLIGYDHHLQKLRAEAVAASGQQGGVVDQVNQKIYGTTILQAGLKTADVIINRKEYARAAGNKLKDKAIEKLMGKK